MRSKSGTVEVCSVNLSQANIGGHNNNSNVVGNNEDVRSDNGSQDSGLDVSGVSLHSLSVQQFASSRLSLRVNPHGIPSDKKKHL
jgi:hypothetical protein